VVEPAAKTVLALNGGSSSIKFALFAAANLADRRLRGKIERIGNAGTALTAEIAGEAQSVKETMSQGDFGAAIQFLLDWLEHRKLLQGVVAVGHRVVHGMQHTAPERITDALLKELRAIIPYDPEHLPAEIHLMEKVLQRCPSLPQVACFDTQFHRLMPRVAKLLAIPRRYDGMGIRRYGFHGLSYAYLMQKLAELEDPAAHAGRVILAHLGNGASMAAVRNGIGIDTTMGFTPSAGLVMGTRSGDIDPGLLGFFGRHEHLTLAQVERMLSHESGLLGVSETSSDIRDLLEVEGTDIRAAEAVALFCAAARKHLGALAAVLGGLDTLVFTAGIGENSAVIRERICSNLDFLGVHLDPGRNAAHAGVISAAGSRVTVRVIRTDEELMIAQIASELVGDATKG
jgi:acetate kinase